MICEKFHDGKVEFEIVVKGEASPVPRDTVWYCPFCGDHFAHIVLEAISNDATDNN